MNLDEIKNAIKVFYPALVLDSLTKRDTRRQISMALGFLLIILLALILFILEGNHLPIHSKEMVRWLSELRMWSEFIIGFFCFLLAIWITMRAFEAFYNSYYFTGLETSQHEPGLSDNKPLITFEAASLIFKSEQEGDLTLGFLRSDFGVDTLIRLGLNHLFVKEFLSGRIGKTNPDKLVFNRNSDGDDPIRAKDFVEALLHLDAELFKAFTAKGVSMKDVTGAADWVEEIEVHDNKLQRYWGKDILGRIPGIGKDWSYGGAYTLEKFAHDVTDREVSQEDVRSYKEERDELEAILSRSGSSNALLVAEEGAGALDVIFTLGSRISRGTVLPALEHKRLYLFDTNAFVAFAKNKATFENEMLHILSESVRAGNVILIINDLPSFIETAKSLGSDLLSILDPYLSLYHFQMIAIASPGEFHGELEGEGKVLHQFEKILIKEKDQESIIRALQIQAEKEEARSGVFFTFQSLEAVAEGVKRYFPYGVLSDSAIHLLSELVPAVISKKKNFIEREDVMNLIQSKTGIKTGTMAKSEKEVLLNLESILHKRIIGQDEAVVAISNAMRRSRSDIQSPDRPMGSFLFLGPTGVGKTETTKALAATFFGKEESIIRLDMSEYQTDDSMKRLIGSFENGKAGVLSSKLRDQAYGVLLLDEFEKTNKEVLNLFLQILDEGFFSDMSGKRVNARNLIIIATSNAGSDMIWNLMKDGQNLTDSKDKIVNEIINRGIFKPELLNRFDGVILFHPLKPDDLRKIAELMLKKLQKRLTEKGIDLVINETLISALMRVGMDPQFGARPMNRAIAEKVEQIIAKKIISGDAVSGSRVELTEEELA